MFSAFGAGQTGADFTAKKSGLEAAARLFELADGAIDDADDPLSEKGVKPDISGKVLFKQIDFAYPTRPSAKIYDGFSLNVGAQQSVAFTGRSGYVLANKQDVCYIGPQHSLISCPQLYVSRCGKSTALQLLLRFYRVDAGSVVVDEDNVSDINLGWLRDHIGYVGQMPVLFKGTIKENVLLGKPEATDAEVVAACKAANAHDFTVSLSSGYDTDIGVGGSLLSGGQRQRVAIARAIIKNP